MNRTGAGAVLLAALMTLVATTAISAQPRPSEKGGLTFPLPAGTPPADPSYRGNPALSWYYMVKDVDTDGDGLSDYEEVHKYLTDPAKADSDGDGIPDGDANERREYTYTIEAVRSLRTWYQPEAMNDTFQDVEVISEKNGVLTYRVILYPYAYDVPTGDPDWKAHASDPAFARLLAPSRTANWDEAMQAEILASLPAGIATDLELVSYLVPACLARRTNPAAIVEGIDPIGLRVDLRGTDAFIPPASKALFKARTSRTNPEECDLDFLYDILLAKTMFDKRLIGSCSLSTTYMLAVLRAAGIPARGIYTNALLDFRDPAQVALLVNLSNKELREGMGKMGPNYYGHQYVEAYVGGRWIKVNNDRRIAPGIHDLGGMTVVCKADVFFDLADTPASDVWRSGFPKPLPYKLVSLSDRYGKYYDESRPRVAETAKPAPWGIDASGKVKAYLIGTKIFCEGNLWRMKGLKVQFYGGLRSFSPAWLDFPVFIVISTETSYDRLPDRLRSLITPQEYGLVVVNRPFIAKLPESTVVFVATGAD